jgi:Tol biopolymer transport system component
MLGIVALGGHVRQLDLRPLLVQSQTPQWSPDGRRIAFTVLDPARGTNSHVYVIGSASGKTPPPRLAVVQTGSDPVSCSDPLFAGGTRCRRHPLSARGFH